MSIENRRIAREASEGLREMGCDWTREDERNLARWYQDWDDEEAADAG